MPRQLPDTPFDPDTPRPLRQFLSFRIARLHMTLNAQTQAILDRHCGLGLPSWRVLSVAISMRADSARAVIRHSGLDPAIVSRALRQLEDDGYMTTTRDESDRRLRRIAPTELGRETYLRVVPIMERRHRALLDALAPVERDLVYGILDKLELVAERRDLDR
jgi:DNA-binding MarR family transcriptional regulator